MAIAKSVVILILFFALASYADAAVKPRPPVGRDVFGGKNHAKDALLPGEKIVNVLSFGAKGDGVFDCTQAFMTAWQAVCKAPGQNRLLVPAGKFLVSSIVFAGPCLAPNPVTIQVEGTILGSTDISEYVDNRWLSFENINGLKIVGGGTFDGQGQESWPYAEKCEGSKSTCVLNPPSLYLTNVQNAIISGIKSLNPKGFHIFVTQCSNIRLRLLKLIAPETSPNTDGIHISTSFNVKINKCTIATGDDCIGMISGTEQVSINRLKCGPGHGISIGSLGNIKDEREVNGITVKNSELIGTDNGLRIKAFPERHIGAASMISFTNINMTNVKNPIIIDQEYQCSANCQKKPSLVKIANIHFTNIRGTSSSAIAVDLRCSKLHPCTGVTFRDIDLKFGSGPATSRCVNVKPVYAGLINPPACP